MVAGGYSELDAMAYAGINLTSRGLVFPSDIPTGDCNMYLDKIERIYTPSTNGLNGIALPCVSSDEGNPLDDIPVGTTSWTPSTQLLGADVFNSWPTALAAAYGKSSTLDVPLVTNHCVGNCTLWLAVRLSGDGGILNFQLGGSTWSLNTSRGFDGSNNTMLWISLPFRLTNVSVDLRITSVSGWNGVGTVYVANGSEVTSMVDNLTRSKSVLELTAGDCLQLPAISSAGQSVGYFNTRPSSTELGDQSIFLESVGSVPLKLNVSVPGPFRGLALASCLGYGSRSSHNRRDSGNGSRVRYRKLQFVVIGDIMDASTGQRIGDN